ncbi:MAG TPA: cysteine-rich CWC family protein [Fimbriimonadaceae bacterium]|nr:cysteine-rich CWC family protein [Fimbriimonadaceae bacterium]
MNDNPSRCPSCGNDNECGLATGRPVCWCGAKAAPTTREACLCRACLAAKPPIFDADGALSREFLLARGSCCGNKCRNCPYGWEAVSP